MESGVVVCIRVQTFFSKCITEQTVEVCFSYDVITAMVKLPGWVRYMFYITEHHERVRVTAPPQTVLH